MMLFCVAGNSSAAISTDEFNTLLQDWSRELSTPMLILRRKKTTLYLLSEQ